MGWEDIEKTTTAGTGQKEKTPYTKFGQGSTLIRILDEAPHSFWSHWMNNQKTSVTCPGKGCPICNIIAMAKANKETPQYNNNHRHAMRIWNYNTNQMEVMIQSKSFFNDLLVLKKEVGDIRNYDLKVIRTGEGKDTKYSILPTAPKEFEITEGIEEIDLADLLKAPTNEEILMLLDGKTWEEINNNEKQDSEVA